MKSKLLLAGWLTVVGLNGVYADLTVVQKIEEPGVPAEVLLQQVMKIKGDKIRFEYMRPHISSFYIIKDTATDDMFWVMNESKTCMKSSGAEIVRTMAKVNDGIDPEVKLAATGQTERVGEYDTEIYTLTTPQIKARYWVAKNYPGYEQFKNEAKKIALGFDIINWMQSKQRSDIADKLPGMVVRTELERGITKALTTKPHIILISVSQDPIDDAVFDIPADYRQMPEGRFFNN